VKPDAYMPFFGKDFFLAMDGHSELVLAAYLRAIWNYWSNTACQGLKNDKEFLRRVCHVDAAEWDSVFETIFDNDKFFTLAADDLWHQKRAQEEYEKTKAKYDAVVRGGQNRWKGARRR
jgi:uncharacterized protein YdaU (DUF1376 family)